MGKIRFYCVCCQRFYGRRYVSFDAWDGRFYCKFCDNAVIKTRKVLKDIILEYLKDAPALGKDVDDYK